MGDFLERLARATDMVDEPNPMLPLVELVGDRRVLIEHHQGVTEYGRNQITVRVKFGCITVLGQRLELAKMSPGQLVISGCIQCVRVERRGK